MTIRFDRNVELVVILTKGDCEGLAKALTTAINLNASEIKSINDAPAIDELLFSRNYLLGLFTALGTYPAQSIFLPGSCAHCGQFHSTAICPTQGEAP